MAELLFSHDAMRDLLEIQSYIAERLENPESAASTIDKIQKTILVLEDFPEAGTLLLPAILRGRDYRFLVSGNYMIFYRIRENHIEIGRILYGRRDYLKVLFPEKEKTEK